MERGLELVDRRQRRGATSIEYALIAFLIGASLVVVFQALGGSVTNLYGDIETEVSDATAGS